jgi:hypothetical protein
LTIAGLDRYSQPMRASIVVLVALAATGCYASELGATDEAVTDSMKACPIPSADAIPGHETVFYQCAEQLADSGRGCGPTGYLVGYGTKYAQRFYHQARPHMSARGQQWIDDVLVCLQRDLRESIDSTTSCDDIWTTAFDSHPACYLEAGFCTLSPFDIAQVVWTIDLKDWVSRDAARQVVRTAIGCGHQYEVWMRALFWDLI